MGASTEDASAPDDLRAQVAQGVSWVLIGQVAVRVVALATTIVIARLLTPRDVGLAAEALVFSRFAYLLADFGLFGPLVQRKDLSDEDRSTAFWTSVAIGAAVSVILIGLAHPIAALYGEPQVAPMVAVLSISVFFTSLGLVPGALLNREMRFRSLELRSIVTIVAGATAAIVVAVITRGPWAIIAQTLAMTGVSTFLLWRSIDWRPRFAYSRNSLGGMAGFSSFMFGSALVYYMERNADNFLIGRFLGAAKLGAYSIAYNVMLVPLRSLASPISQVFFPALSQISEPRRMGDVWIRATRLVAFLTVPSYLGMIVVAPDFVPLVFGRRWEAAIPVLQVLSCAGLVQSLASQLSVVLMALDRASVVFRLSFISSVVAVISFGLGLHWGIVGVAAAYAIVSVGFCSYSILVACRFVHIEFLQFLRAMSGVLQAGALMAIVVLGARLLLVDEAVPGTARLAIVIAIGGAVFLAASLWRAPEVVSDVREFWNRRRRRDGAEVEAAIGGSPVL